MTEFCGLRARAYAFKLDDDTGKKKAKDSKKFIVKREIILQNYVDALFNDEVVVRSQLRFRSDHHRVYTEEVNKIALSSNDDKRIQTFDRVTTFPYGMNVLKICENEMLLKDKFSDKNIDKNMLNNDLQNLRNKSQKLGDEAQVIRNESLQVRNELQKLRREAQVLRNESQKLRNEAQVIRSRIQKPKNKPQLARNESQVLRNESQKLRSEAQIIRNESLLVRNELRERRNEEQVIRNESQKLRSEAQVIRNESQVHRNTLFKLDEKTYMCFIKSKKTCNDSDGVLDKPSFEDIETDKIQIWMI